MTGGPRAVDPGTLARFAQGLLVISAVLGLLSMVLSLVAGTIDLARPGVLIVNTALPAVCLLLGLRRRLLTRLTSRVPVWLLPLSVIWLAVLVMIYLRNNLPGAQLFFGFPVLYAAYLFSRPLALLVAANATAGVGVLALSVASVNEAVHAFLFAATAFTTLTLVFSWMRQSRERLVRTLHTQAHQDFLTGLLARRTFEDAVSTSVLSALQGGPGCALLLVDVDWLKQINDRHGHLVGDQVLVHVAQVLRSCPGFGGGGVLIGRWGGDEFAVLLQHHPLPDAQALAEQLVQAVGDHPFAGAAPAVSVTIGLAHAPTHARTAAALLRCADEGLYEAKRAGRGRVGVMS